MMAFPGSVSIIKILLVFSEVNNFTVKICSGLKLGMQIFSPEQFFLRKI